MKTEKNLQMGILIVDVALLIVFTVVFFKTMVALCPDSVNGIFSLPWLIVTYVTSFVFSFLLMPSVAQYRHSKWEEIVKRALDTSFLMLLFISLITIFTRPEHHYPRTFYCTSVITYAIFLTTERCMLKVFFNHMRANKRNQKAIVFLGNEPMVTQLLNYMKDPVFGYDIKGIFYDGEATCEEMESMKLGARADIITWLAAHPEIKELYGYIPKENQDKINIIAKYCDNHLIRFYYLPAVDVFRGNTTVSYIGDIPIIARREEPLLDPVNRFMKRTFDIVFSSLVLCTIFPIVWVIVSIAIKIQSPGPIFFKQARTGLDGKTFKCYKFRSMKVNADSDKVQATKDDPRKFPFGNLMRKTNIDELPQFINVFLGDMSVVGPRPHMLKHTEEYSSLINRFMLRHLAKPGITGLAQVSGFRGETHYIDQMEGRVKMDIKYIENWSFLLDMKIIVKTVTNMLGKEKGNAY